MATIRPADEFLLLENEGVVENFDPFAEYDAIAMFDVDEAELRLKEPPNWGYRVPCPGVRYYFCE